MCGRFSLTSPSSHLLEAFKVQLEFDFLPQYNIAPTENVLAVIFDHNKPLAVIFKWGFVPHWSKQDKPFKQLINARGETIDQLPAFRDAFRKNRCLILASGFYEWKKSGSNRIPFYFHLENNETFAFAGIWSRCMKENRLIETCAIITTSAYELVQPFHDRMPIIIAPNDYTTWLNRSSSFDQLKNILSHPFIYGLTVDRVTKKVNSALYKGEDCIEGVKEMSDETQ